MREYHFSMQMTVEQCERYYRGSVKYVVVTCDNGLTVQLPIEKFRPYVTTNGIRGRFRLIVDDNNRFQALEKTY